MSKKLYVYSTLSASVMYNLYGEAAAGNTPPILGTVHVKGGAGVMGEYHLETPRGVVTEITQEQADILRRDPVFLMHEKNGYVAIGDEDLAGDAAAALLEGRDVSAPLVEEDFNPDPEKGPVLADGKKKK